MNAIQLASVAVIVYVLVMVRTPPIARANFWRHTAGGRRAPFELAPQWAWKSFRSRMEHGPQHPTVV